MDQEHYISHLREEVNYEIARLKTLLRDSRITDEDRSVALAMLEFYEDARMTEGRLWRQVPDRLVPRRAKSVLGKKAELKEPQKPCRKKAQAA